MLATEYRLRKKGDIDRVWKHGRSFVTPIFSLKYLKSDLPGTRFAVIVGTKVHKRAVIRNKAKRRLREALRVALPKVRPGFDVLVVARKGIETKEYADILQTMTFALQKSRLVL